MLEARMTKDDRSLFGYSSTKQCVFQHLFNEFVNIRFFG
jgi:hypothetical protein